MFHRSACLRFIPRVARGHLVGAGCGLSIGAATMSQWSAVCSTARRNFSTTQRRLASDYYGTLGVSPTASAEEIKAAYKRMALQFHPDRNKDPNAEEKFKTISEAYTIIGNKTKRAEYDAQRQFMGGGGMGGGGTPRGSYSSQRPPYQSGSQTYAGAYPGRSAGGFQTMTTEEADRLFREIFGSMNMEQMLRDMDNRTRGGAAAGSNNAGGSNPFGGMPFGASGGQQAYRPHFQSQREEVHMDANGNRTVKREFRDANGNVYNIFTTTSNDPNASMNQSEEEASEKYRDPNGRFRYGSNASSGVGGDSYGGRYAADNTTPFGRIYNANMTAGPGNMNARLYLLVFLTVIGMLTFGLLSFIITNPFMWVLLGALFLLRRRF